MTLGNQLSMLTTPKLEQTKVYLNLSDEEERVFDLLSKRKSIGEIALRLNVSTRTVDRVVFRIKEKLNN